MDKSDLVLAVFVITVVFLVALGTKNLLGYSPPQPPQVCSVKCARVTKNRCITICEKKHLLEQDNEEDETCGADWDCTYKDS